MERAAYKALPMSPMKSSVKCLQPASMRADSPAIDAMTDLRQTALATITAASTLAQANQAMIASGVRLLLVLDDDDHVSGLITARDIVGEKPVKLLRERGGKRNDLKVADLMVPRSEIEVLDIATVAHAEVGHIVATLKEAGRQHALVVEAAADGAGEIMRGIFSATQIGRRLGMSIVTFEVAHTFADIEAALAD
jgi:CBS domain containing-hemolysin-like protein